jgi:hypothetical protein
VFDDWPALIRTCSSNRRLTWRTLKLARLAIASSSQGESSGANRHDAPGVRSEPPDAGDDDRVDQRTPVGVTGDDQRVDGIAADLLEATSAPSRLPVVVVTSRPPGVAICST